MIRPALVIVTCAIVAGAGIPSGIALLEERISGNSLGSLFAPVVLALSVGALGLEALIVGWRRSALRRLVTVESKSEANDLFYWILALLSLAPVLSVVLSFGLASGVERVLTRFDLNTNILDRVDSQVATYLIVFLVVDLMGYVQHRLAHSVGWWWDLHKLHHSAERYNVITHYRINIFEAIPRSIVYSVPIALLGPLDALDGFLLYNAGWVFVSLVLHSEIQCSWGWLEHVLVSPRSHRVHHSIQPEHYHKNYGFSLTIWDKLFGTWCGNETEGDLPIGLVDNPFNKSNPVRDLLGSGARSVRTLLATPTKLDADPPEQLLARH